LSQGKHPSHDTSLLASLFCCDRRKIEGRMRERI
jgi:hypothetical protein